MSGQLQEARTAAEAAKASLSAEKIGAQQRIASLEKQRSEVEVSCSETPDPAPRAHAWRTLSLRVAERTLLQKHVIQELGSR